MRSYRFARRSFLQGIGAGAVGLSTMLRNLEASAQGMTPPPRLLITHWPVGTVHYAWRPTGSGTTYTTSPILKPFEDAGLRNDMIAIYGLHLNGNPGVGYSSNLPNAMPIPNGGGHEGGTVKVMCGIGSAGTRNNGGEHDDALAGGPSWDQIFLKNVAALQRPGLGYANAICDARVDSFETSTQCLSYSYTTQQSAGWGPNTGMMLTNNVPLLPTLSPVNLYNQLFSGMMPGGGSSANDMFRLLKARKSVLDYARSQLAQIKTLAPGSEATKIQAHADAIRAIETSLSNLINLGVDGGIGSACMVPMMPDPTLLGKTGSKFDYTQNTPALQTMDDTAIHAAIGAAHFGILRAAFQCDLIRVATFQWSPGTNHVSFKDMMPNQPAGSIFMHHPTSHLISNPAEVVSALPTGTHGDYVTFLINVHTWYNQQTAALLSTLKNTTDVFGGNLLANTIVPHVTEVAQTTHLMSPIPALIFGGSALGMKGGQYVDLSSGIRCHNDYWMTIAQAYFKTTTPLANLTAETFYKTGVSPIAGLWA